MKTVGILSLGCARNLVDSEVLVGRLKRKGYKIVDLGPVRNSISNGVDKADVALVNTCAFIKEAKEESIETILDLIELKKEGRLKSIVVAGCLSQRYKKKLAKLLPEIDAFIGVMSLNHTRERLRLSPVHYAYVKICEGCINSCSFCAIPNIKPRFTSRQIHSIVHEIKCLDSQGCVEVNLIGQDITAYGWDLYGRSRLVRLIEQILKNSHRINWLRLLYLSPERVNDDLIELIASSPRIVKYIDLPLQHINNRILRLMQRKINASGIFKLIDKIRKRIPDVALRTSLMVGFPGETDKQFRELLSFIQKIRFDRLGLFMYSREEGTEAFGFRGQIPQRIKEARYNIIMSSQQEIAGQINEKFQGETLKVLVEEKQEDVRLRHPTDKSMVGYGGLSAEAEGESSLASADGFLYIGRSQYDAPEVDGSVFIKAGRELPIGNFIDVKITDTLEYDLVGELQ